LDEHRKLKLALDTTLSSGSIALATAERVIYSTFFDIKITHSETLMPAIDHALKFCGAQKSDLSAIYACQGPGSFTGLRIGIATAKGIAFGLNIPLFTYSSLELAALAASGLGKNILAAIDAKMKELYLAYFDSNLGEIIAPQVIKPEEVCRLPLQDFILCGTGADLLTPLLKASGHEFYNLNSTLHFPNAAGLFALPILLPGKHHPQNLVDLEPMYLRDSSAQVKRSESFAVRALQ